MLLQLEITDFAIIEHTAIEFTDGMNVLTGETGAGKSILLDALGAVLGARVSPDLVRTGARQARVEAAFGVEDVADRLEPLLVDLGIDAASDEPLILAREIHAGGRSTGRVNGRMATASVLAQIGTVLVDIHGQSDHLAMLKTSEQRAFLDRFGGLDADRTPIAAMVHQWREVTRRMAELQRDDRSRVQQVDMLRFQIDEIEAAALERDEESNLAGVRDVLRNADRLRADALSALETLAADDLGESVSIASLMRSLVGHVSDIAVLDPKSAGLAERATELLVLTEDLARDLRDYADSVEADEERLAEIEDRLALIQTLKRKYGATVSEVIAFGDQAKSDLEKLTSTELDIEALREREALLAKDLSRRAMILSLRRREAATALANAVERSIRDLRLGSSHIAIDLSARADPDGVEIDTPNGTERVHVDETGIDVIEYLFAPNTGESLKPLARIASGGEMARLMLAIKSILSEVDLTPTLVFDEIDVGVGGRSGQVVGEKLWGISTRHQVIVVSHLSQVAAYAAHHLRIEKQESSGRTVSTVRLLDDEERARELATMLDGLPVSDASLASAREIMARAAAFIERSTAVRA